MGFERRMEMLAKYCLSGEVSDIVVMEEIAGSITICILPCTEHTSMVMGQHVQ